MTMAPSSRALGRSGSAAARESGRVIVAGSLGPGHLDVLPLDFLALDRRGVPVLVLEEPLPTLEVIFDRPGAAAEGEDDYLGRVVVALDRLDFQLARAHLARGRARLPGLRHLEFQALGVDGLLRIVRPDQEQDHGRHPRNRGIRMRQMSFDRFMTGRLLIVAAMPGRDLRPASDRATLRFILYST